MRAEPWWCGPAVFLAAVVGLGLMADTLLRSSATFDEVAYMRIAARWWRTGDQSEITYLGSPVTFWKWQQVPVLWGLDRAGFSDVVDEPIVHQRVLLPLVRLWSLSIWLVALLATALWSRSMYGPCAMALAAWLFALSPNLLAHGALVTMELPLVACTTGIFFCFWRFLRGDGWRYFWLAAALSGVSWSCKFTTVLYPPILGVVWWVDRWCVGDRGFWRVSLRVATWMLGFTVVMLAANLCVTGFALLPLSSRTGSHPSVDGSWGHGLARLLELPLPQDWVGFAHQLRHQRSGGSSYLWGERRMHGWWYYYFVALAVKVPLTFWILVAARLGVARHGWPAVVRDRILPLSAGLFLAITAAGSSRNYGLRYLLPLAPLAIVWVSALAECGGWARRLACVGLLGQTLAILSIHPYELSYFNTLAGGTIGGRHILSDSNLDWGQGLKELERLQRLHPEWRDLTLYYFGDTDPKFYGIAGRCYVVDAGAVHPGLPPALAAETEYVAVSASLQWGPWGPKDYFRGLNPQTPAAITPDGTITVYRARDLKLAKSDGPS